MIAIKTKLTKAECAALLMAVAQKNGVSPGEVRRGIERCIDDIWHCQAPSSIEYRRSLFGRMRPTVEEFLYETTQEMKKQGILS